MSNKNSFFDELKRRNVIRMAGLYLVGAWLLTQVASTVLPAFDVPSWALRGLIITLTLGFIPALVFSWVFELTPQGLRRDEDVTPEQSIAPQTGRRMDRMIIVVLLLALGYFCFDKFILTPRREAALVAATVRAQTVSSPHEPSLAASPKSIAVLPFENLSSDKENAFFTDGVQDEILTDLAKVADLKVISRTSVMQYRDAAARNLRKIGAELGVAHLLEGSVQRASGKVRVNAQLIDARTDAHLWAQTYDRDLADVFAIQSEIAQTIAGQLQARLSPNEQKAIERPPTTDLEAHDLYLRARALDDLFNDPNGREYLLQAAQLLDEAVQRDPNFLLAYCLLCEVHTDLYFGGFDHTPARLELGRVALEKAERLQPDAGEVHFSKGVFAYHGHRDYEGARAEFALARRTLPNSSRLAMISAAVDRRQGRWDDAFKNFHRAIELDPRDSTVLEETGFTYTRTRRFAEGRPYLERAAAANPNDVFVRLVLWYLPYFERGETASVRSRLDELLRANPKDAPRLAAYYVEVALAERDRAAAERALQLVPTEGSVDTTLNALWPRDWYVGLVATSFGDAAGAQKAFAAARENAIRITHEQPDYPPGWLILGLLDAGLGHKSDAIAEGRRARDLLPISTDALDGPIYATDLAVIYAWVGEKDLALEQLKLSASIPCGVQYGVLKLSPMWDSLRGEARFEEIVASLAPKVTPAK